MQALFSVNGTYYNVTITPGGLERKVAITDGENAGRTLSGLMIRDLIGTYVNYTIKLETKNLDVAQYDALVSVLRQPVDSHNIVMPYDQGSLSFKAYLTAVNDKLMDTFRGVNRWGGLSIEFVAMEPQYTPED